LLLTVVVSTAQPNCIETRNLIRVAVLSGADCT
jgi:hypothetical protein